MITFIKPGPNPESGEQVVLYNMLYGNSFEISYSHLDVRGMLAYRGGISKNEPVFYHDTEEGSIYTRPLRLYMEFPKVKERVFDNFIETIVKASDHGTTITLVNTYDTLQFPVEYELLYDMERIPARIYEGFILDYRHKYNRDVWRRGEAPEPVTLPGDQIPYDDPGGSSSQIPNIIERSVDLSVTFISGRMVVKHE